MTRRTVRQVAERDKFGLVNLPASANLSHTGARRARAKNRASKFDARTFFTLAGRRQI